MNYTDTIFLDSNVVAGIIAVGRDGNSSQKVNENLIEWGRCVKTLADIISPTAHNNLIVPTPICYELMAWNKKWFDIVNNDQQYRNIFKYSNRDILNCILKTGAKYAYESAIRIGGDKLYTMDPLLAAYSIKHGCCILTENEHDFPDSHFDVIGFELLKLISSKNNICKKQRSILYLLKPKDNNLNT